MSDLTFQPGGIIQRQSLGDLNRNALKEAAPYTELDGHITTLQSLHSDLSKTFYRLEAAIDSIMGSEPPANPTKADDREHNNKLEKMRYLTQLLERRAECFAELANRLERL